MALTLNHPTLKEARFGIATTSVGTTPVACYGGVPYRGVITKLSAVLQGAITTANATITVAINGTTNAALGFVIPFTGSAAGTIVTAIPTTAVYVNEDDVISFTPSGATGASIACEFTTSVQTA